jgi:hypothetical protein
MKYLFHPDAELELNASADYYEERKTNLGRDNTIVILAVMQLQREPSYWKSRAI